MKQDELRKHSKCSNCGKVITHTGLPLFWTITIERHGIKVNTLIRQGGLAALLGSAELARVMGTDEDVTQQMMDPVTVTLCEPCATEKQLCIAELAERGGS
ncbi:MAG: hypothetical protein WC683_04230 [bacterium]